MCGGVIVHWKSITDPSTGETMMTGEEEKVVSYKYYKNPVIPAAKGASIELFPWGNRDDKLSKLPHTGWCRLESLEGGKWNWLHPEPVDIPAIGGIEKGKWLRFSGPLKGVLVWDEYDSPHVYMLTQPASKEYAAYTKHPRMPVIDGDWRPMEAPRPAPVS